MFRLPEICYSVHDAGWPPLPGVMPASVTTERIRLMKTPATPFSLPAAALVPAAPTRSWMDKVRAALVRAFHLRADHVAMTVWNGGPGGGQHVKNPSPRLYINGKIISTSRPCTPGQGGTWKSTT